MKDCIQYPNGSVAHYCLGQAGCSIKPYQNLSPNMTDQERIAALEKRIEDLEGKLASLPQPKYIDQLGHATFIPTIQHHSLCNCELCSPKFL